MADKIAITEVEIAFFKPTGWSSTFYVETDDRGLAVNTVLSRYRGTMEYPCLNYVTAKIKDSDKLDPRIHVIEVSHDW